MVPLILVISCAVVAIITSAVVIVKQYNKTLRSKDWYDDLYLEFSPVECEHSKRIKFSDVDWKFNFTLRKEKTPFPKRKGIALVQRADIQRKLFCEECNKKRWFREANSPKEIMNMTFLRLTYMFIFLMALVVIAGSSMTVLEWTGVLG